MTSLHVGIDARLPDQGQGGVLSVVKSMAFAFKTFEQPKIRRTWVVLEQASWWKTALPPQDHVVEVRAPFGAVGLSLASFAPAIASKIAPIFLKLLGDRKQLDSLFRARRIDVVHLPYQDGILTDLPSVYFPHDLQHLHFPEYFSSAQIRHREQRWRNRAMRAETVVAAAPHIKSDLIQRWGLDETRIMVFPFPPPPPIAMSDVQLPSLQRPYVLYPAVFWPHKNHAHLVRAMSILKQRRVEVDLVLTGSKHSNLARILQLIKMLDISDRVKYLGHVNDALLSALFYTAEAIVVPSLSEAFSLTAFDALRYNRPLLCSDREFFRSQCKEFARYFDPLDPNSIANEIERQLSENKAIGMTNAGRQIDHQGLSHELFAENLVCAYHECFNRRMN